MSQVVHIELERDEVKALLEGRDPDCGSPRAGFRERARGKLRKALRAALSSSPEQGGELLRIEARERPMKIEDEDGEQRERLNEIAHLCALHSVGPRDVWDRDATFLRTLASQEQGEAKPCKTCGGKKFIPEPVGPLEPIPRRCPACQPPEHLERPEVPEEASRLAFKACISDDEWAAFDPDLVERLVDVALATAQSAIRKQEQRRAIRDLVDGWAEGELCPAAQDTADAIAKQERQRVREALLSDPLLAIAEDAWREAKKTKQIYSVAAGIRAALDSLEDE